MFSTPIDSKLIFFIALIMTLNTTNVPHNLEEDDQKLQDGITIANNNIYSEFLKQTINNMEPWNPIYPMYTLEELEYSEGDTFDIHLLSETKLHVTVKFRSNLDIGLINRVAMCTIKYKARLHDPNEKQDFVTYIKLYIECMKMINLQKIDFCYGRVLVGPNTYFSKDINTPIYDCDTLISHYNSTDPSSDFHLYKFQLMCLGYKPAIDCAIHIDFLNNGLTPELETLISESDLYRYDTNSFIILVAQESDTQKLKLFNEYKPANARYEVVTFLDDRAFVHCDLKNVDRILTIPFVPRIILKPINHYRDNLPWNSEHIRLPFGPRDELETVDYSDPLTQDYNILFRSKYCGETTLGEYEIVKHAYDVNDPSGVINRYNLIVKYTIQIEIDDEHLTNIVNDVHNPLYNMMMFRLEDEFLYRSPSLGLIRATRSSFLRNIPAGYTFRSKPTRIPFESMFKKLPFTFVHDVCSVFTFICENIDTMSLTSVKSKILNTMLHRNTTYFNGCMRWIRYIIPYDYMFDFSTYETSRKIVQTDTDTLIFSFGNAINGIRQNRFESFDLLGNETHRTIIVNYFILKHDYKALKYCFMNDYELNMRMLIMDPYVWRLFDSYTGHQSVKTVCNMNVRILDFHLQAESDKERAVRMIKFFEL